MINRLQIENFKSIKKLDLGLGNLNILIGPNGSGKSNLLSLFSLLQKASKGELDSTIGEWGGGGRITHGGKGPMSVGILFSTPNYDGLIGTSKEIEYHFSLVLFAGGGMVVNSENILIPDLSSKDEGTIFLFRDQPFSIELYNERKKKMDQKYSRNSYTGRMDKYIDALNPHELAAYQIKDPISYPTSYWILNQMQIFLYYRPIDIGENSAVRQGQTTRPDKAVKEDGSNLLPVIMNMHPDTFDELEEYMKSAFPELKRIKMASDSAGKLALEWYEESFKDPFYISQVSDGAIRMLYLLTVLLSESKQSLICIEEPEIGLHPNSIKILGAVLKRVKDRGDKQVIVSTHSNLLVSEMDAEDMIVTEKRDGATQCRRLSSDQFTKWLKEYSLGELWVEGHFEE